MFRSILQRMPCHVIGSYRSLPLRGRGISAAVGACPLARLDAPGKMAYAHCVRPRNAIAALHPRVLHVRAVGRLVRAAEDRSPSSSSSSAAAASPISASPSIALPPRSASAPSMARARAAAPRGSRACSRSTPEGAAAGPGTYSCSMRPACAQGRHATRRCPVAARERAAAPKAVGGHLRTENRVARWSADSLRQKTRGLGGRP